MVIFLSMAFGFPVRDVGFAANDAVNLVIDFTPLESQRAASCGRVTKVTPLLLLGVTEARRLAWRSGYSECVYGISEVSGEKSVLSGSIRLFLGPTNFSLVRESRSRRSARYESTEDRQFSFATVRRKPPPVSCRIHTHVPRPARIIRCA
jgi:hypothetical protein